MAGKFSARTAQRASVCGREAAAASSIMARWCKWFPVRSGAPPIVASACCFWPLRCCRRLLRGNSRSGGGGNHPSLSFACIGRRRPSPLLSTAGNYWRQTNMDTDTSLALTLALSRAAAARCPLIDRQRTRASSACVLALRLTLTRRHEANLWPGSFRVNSPPELKRPAPPTV